MGYIEKEQKRDLKKTKQVYKSLEKARELILSTDYSAAKIEEMVGPIWRYMSQLREEIRVMEIQ